MLLETEAILCADRCGEIPFLSAQLRPVECAGERVHSSRKHASVARNQVVNLQDALDAPQGNISTICREEGILSTQHTKNLA